MSQFDHLISGCPTLATNEYIIRHDKVCTHLHYSICKKSGTETAENWYSHIPKPVTEHEDVIKGYKRIERFWQTGLT
jgi:hypothetical protein